MLSGKEQRNQESGHLLVGDQGAVLVLNVHEESKDVSPVAAVGVEAAFLDDGPKEADHLLACGVALAVRFCGSVRPKDGDRGQSVVKVMVQRLDFLEDVSAGVFAVQAPGGSEDGKFRQRRQEVGRPRIAPVLAQVRASFFLNLSHVLLQTGRPQPVGHGLELHLSALLGGVVHYAIPKHGAGEVVYVVLRKDVVAGLEEDFLRFRSDEVRQSLVKDLLVFRNQSYRGTEEGTVGCEG